MEEATNNLHQAAATSHAQRQAMGRAIRVLAQQRAIKATKQALSGTGSEARSLLASRDCRCGRGLSCQAPRRANRRREGDRRSMDS
jgi:hypothetical protein